MRTLIALLLVGALAVPAMGGANPNVRCYVDFDPPNYVHYLLDQPMGQYTDVGCLMLDCIPGGITTVSLKVTVVGDLNGSITFTNILPGDLAIGAWDTGITLSSTDCMLDDPLCFATFTVFTFGGSADIIIGDHPDFPRWVVDCADGTDFYCVLAHGGWNKVNLAGEAGCDCSSPVEDATWGVIKSLYR
jgi:hypothetical protein